MYTENHQVTHIPIWLHIQAILYYITAQGNHTASCPLSIHGICSTFQLNVREAIHPQTITTIEYIYCPLSPNTITLHYFSPLKHGKPSCTCGHPMLSFPVSWHSGMHWDAMDICWQSWTCVVHVASSIYTTKHFTQKAAMVYKGTLPLSLIATVNHNKGIDLDWLLYLVHFFKCLLVYFNCCHCLFNFAEDHVEVLIISLRMSPNKK